MSTTAVQTLALSAADLAQMLGVSSRQIYTWHATGTLGPVPVVLSARVTRWDAKEVADWWTACRAAGRRIGRREWLAMMQEGGHE